MPQRARSTTRSRSRRENGLVEVGIHIADPCAFIAPGGPWTSRPRTRGTTYYFPEGKILMIPPVLSEGAASLVEGQDRPALSFLVAVDAEGRAAGVEIVRSIVRIASRLDYDEVDATLRARHRRPCGAPDPPRRRRGPPRGREALRRRDRASRARNRDPRRGGRIARADAARSGHARAASRFGGDGPGRRGGGGAGSTRGACRRSTGGSPHPTGAFPTPTLRSRTPSTSARCGAS